MKEGKIGMMDKKEKQYVVRKKGRTNLLQRREKRRNIGIMAAK